MWTGDKVITKNITAESLEDINDVLKRKCVIWDNEHANDYDQKRVFLGKLFSRFQRFEFIEFCLFSYRSLFWKDSRTQVKNIWSHDKS